MADIAASFQDAVVDVLVQKVIEAAVERRVSSVVVAGGVACNRTLRHRLKEKALERGIPVFFPRPAYCADNGAMIAVAAYHRLLRGERAELCLDVRSRFPVENLSLKP
jgi:N6-L-threonylcarbamoyladenine synthase